MVRKNKWLVVPEKQKGVVRFTIRRWVYLPDGKKLERLPVHRYKSLRDNREQLEEFCTRLNAQEFKIDEGRKAVEIKHAFISPELLDEYKEFLIVKIPTKSRALSEFHYLKVHFLNFFINSCKMSNPVDWFKAHETLWARYLLSPEAPAASTTKKEVVLAANRFIEWLHKKRPEEVPLLRFRPLTTARYKQITAEREMKGENRLTQFIKQKNFTLIRKEAPDNIRSLILLGRYFGLRRSETLGLRPEDVRKGYLSVERQLTAYKDGQPIYASLKGREARKVPYWGISVEQVYSWVKSIQLMHQDTLTDRWNDLMTKLKLSYNFHDLRHTFITKSLRKRLPRDVQLAAGHKDISTTMKYAHDDRTMVDEIYSPDNAA